MILVKLSQHVLIYWHVLMTYRNLEGKGIRLYPLSDAFCCYLKKDRWFLKPSRLVSVCVGYWGQRTHRQEGFLLCCQSLAAHCQWLCLQMDEEARCVSLPDASLGGHFFAVWGEEFGPWTRLQRSQTLTRRGAPFQRSSSAYGADAPNLETQP